MNGSDKPDYQGKRALMLLRVSTPVQEDMYGWPSQERSIREKLLEPLGLQLDEKKHIIRDSYTGLEFRERPALNKILEMAKQGDFDVLVMDVLDRGLGRKALAREIYRMQLRELGIHILTTDPNDHSDDDTLIGEMVRLVRGYVAEEELNNIRRRTMNGKRERAEEGKLLGAATPTYGYMYPFSSDGSIDRTRYILNEVVICVDQYEVEWTEVKAELTELHQFCADMREKLNNPTYIPPLKKKREVLGSFGITAILWGTEHEPRYKIEVRPPSIVSMLSSS